MVYVSNYLEKLSEKKKIQWNRIKELTDVALKWYIAQVNYLRRSNYALFKSWFSGYHYFTSSYKGLKPRFGVI